MAQRAEESGGTPSFSMQGGEGDGSFSKCGSQSTKTLSSCITPLLEEFLSRHFSPPQGAGPINHVDFGCAVGANTIGLAKLVTKTLKSRPEFAERDFMCYFADLPSNDFNTLFNQFPPLASHSGGAESDGERTWFAAGVPGNQYKRMFPRSSLHIATTTLTLHYLPAIPKSITDKSSPTFNRGRLSAHGASPAVAEVFADASREGLRRFFQCRAEELVSGGVIAFYFPSRPDRAHPERQMTEDSLQTIWLKVESAWRELVDEGVMAADLLDTFNFPSCHPSKDEVEEAINHGDSCYQIQKLEYIAKHPFTPPNSELVLKDAQSYVKWWLGMMRSGLGNMLSAQMSPQLIDALFERVGKDIERDYLEKNPQFPMFMNLCVGILIRK